MGMSGFEVAIEKRHHGAMGTHLGPRRLGAVTEGG